MTRPWKSLLALRNKPWQEHSNPLIRVRAPKVRKVLRVLQDHQDRRGNQGQAVRQVRQVRRASQDPVEEMVDSDVCGRAMGEGVGVHVLRLHLAAREEGTMTQLSGSP